MEPDHPNAHEGEDAPLNDRDARLKRLGWRAGRRGMREADLIIGQFAQDHLADMTDAELTTFERLLKVPDAELYPWIMGKAPVDPAFDTPVFQALKASVPAWAHKTGQAPDPQQDH